MRSLTLDEENAMKIAFAELDKKMEALSESVELLEKNIEFEINENAPTIHSENADVMMSRSISGNKVQLYYSPENGYNIVVGENRLQLSSSGDFNVVAQDAVITANSDGIKLSKYNGETFSATKAEPLITALNGFCSDLQSLCITTVANPWTAPMAIPLCEAVVKFQNQLQNIKSDFVKIS